MTASNGPNPSDHTASIDPADARKPLADAKAPRLPESIGPYRILGLLGEGGFGVVYAAERREPIQQRVAIKVIKPGMDSRAVIARFEQERQALAVMTHPNIARVFDAGVTSEAMGSRPYFVMEHVAGEPITGYCDRHSLTLRQRLELFIPVCDAVQHAHHKGMIHRDIKPGNILVTVRDGQPVPKVIDFGVAKATAATFTDKTIFTEAGQLIGTPEYMSPEQAEMGATDIDTRTDVYSLGAVLYELLAGAVPFDTGTLRAAALLEIQRIIREVDPPKPSTRLTSLGAEESAGVAKMRQMDREALAGELRRELDWIPLKALRKDRTQRYETAKDLAGDIRNYLDGKPLVAGPESTGYRWRKFVRRNRGAVFAGSLIAAALILGVGGLGVGAWVAGREADSARRAEGAARAAEQEQRRLAEDNAGLAELEAAQRARADDRAAEAARAEAAAIAARDAERERAEELRQVSEFQSQMLRRINTTQAGIDLIADIERRFTLALENAGVPEVERAARLEALRRELASVSATDAAAAMIDRTILRPAIAAIDERFGGQPLVGAQLRQAIADIYWTIGLYESALPLQEAALATRRTVLGGEHPDTLITLDNIASLLAEQGRFAEAEPYYREALEKLRQVLGEEHPDTIASISNFGAMLREQGRLTEAEVFTREAWDKNHHVLGPEHPDTLTSLHNLAALLRSMGRFAEAELCCREALHARRRVLGEEHPHTLVSMGAMGAVLQDLGRSTDAEPYCIEALEKCRRVLGAEHPYTLSCMINMGAVLRSQGQLAEAEAFYLEALETGRRVLGEEHPRTLGFLSHMGNLRLSQGRLIEAESCYSEALDARRRVLGEEHPHTLTSLNNMGNLLVRQGQLAEAEPYYRQALDGRRQEFGEAHPDTLESTSDLGVLFVEQRRHADAVALLAPVEPAARAAFTGHNARRLGRFLTALARARVGLGHAAGDFRLAEAGLLEAYSMLVQSDGEANSDVLACVQGLVDLYTAWDLAEPGKELSEAAEAWRTRLPEPPGG